MSDAVLKYGEPENYVNRELSWLEFNYRILGEARDKTTPLFEMLTDDISLYLPDKPG